MISRPIALLDCVLSFLIATTYAQNCVLTVPPNPLSAKGLATPYFMKGCNQIEFSDQGCFVEAAIFDPATNQISVYNPLVVNDGAVEGTDFIKPVAVTIPRGATVGIWFGSNAVTLQLEGDTSSCVNGLGSSLFGQFAHCNGDRFMKVTQAAVKAGQLQIAPPGQGAGGECPTVRDFRIVDSDQSDNVDATYLLINGTVLAQNTPENSKSNRNAVELSNGSDNALVNDILAPVLGCTPITSPSLTAPSGRSAALATNELQGNFFPPAGGPALVPLNGNFAVINNNDTITQSLAKTNLYRAGVGQPLAANRANASGTTYCHSFAASGIFIAQSEGLFTNKGSPAPDVAVDLFTFMAQRFDTSFGPVPALGCTTIFGISSPVTLTMDDNGVITGATIDTAPLQAILDGRTKPVRPGAATPTGNATTTDPPTTTVSPAQASAAYGKGSRQTRHKGHSNQAGGSRPWRLRFKRY